MDHQNLIKCWPPVPSSCHECDESEMKLAPKPQKFCVSWVNFTNILRAPFSYESFAQSFFCLQWRLNFLSARKIIGANALIKCWWNWLQQKNLQVLKKLTALSIPFSRYFPADTNTISFFCKKKNSSRNDNCRIKRLDDAMNNCFDE